MLPSEAKNSEKESQSELARRLKRDLERNCFSVFHVKWPIKGHASQINFWKLPY